MIPILAAIVIAVCVGILVRRQNRQKRKDELSAMKRHAANYVEEHKRLA